MFNQETKGRYIEEKESSVVMPNNYLTLQFNYSEEYEIELEKDIFENYSDLITSEDVQLIETNSISN